MGGREWVLTAVLALSAASRCRAFDELAFLGRLQLVHAVFRNGARAPIVTYPEDNFTEDKWGTKWGHLTQLGREQQYDLGCYLRKRYADFLPLVYKDDDVLVRSCDSDRVLDSASLVMRGLYTPQLADGEFIHVFWQSVPVHTVPEEIDLLLPKFVSPCPAFQAELDKLNKSTEYQSFRNLMTYLDEFSKSISGLSALDLHDVLKCKQYHGVPLPGWSREVFPEPSSSNYDWHVFFSVGSTAPIRRMITGRLVEDILEHMDMKINGNSESCKKLYAYSAHDYNLVALLSALNVWEGKEPCFSSCVLIELRLNNYNEHVVTVSYKNSTSEPPQVLQVPGCRSIACPYHEFVAALSSEMYGESECYGMPEVPQHPTFPHPNIRFGPSL
ncbi:lysosomal acid phosphatase-like [Bacillus rossius redtenbacheri]|uniref:lysosomal acid phosphatase-like n=1 Tax=Bacillus rossius redtenbacheri TaxID=93214 RepID=UPI002FDE36FE